MKLTTMVGAALVGLLLPACSDSSRSSSSVSPSVSSREAAFVAPHIPPIQPSDLRRCSIVGEVIELPEKEARELWALVEGIMSRIKSRPVDWPDTRNPYGATSSLRFYTDAKSRQPDCIFSIWALSRRTYVGFFGQKAYPVSIEDVKEIHDKLEACRNMYRKPGS